MFGGKSMEAGARTAVPVVIAVAAAGIIPGVISVSGLGPNLVSLLGPALVTFGIPLLAAHLFILYFGVIADITPPVAVAAYAASGVAQPDPFQTGIEAFSLSLNKAIVPFAFVLAPGIVLLRTGVVVPNSDKTYRVVNVADLTDPTFAVPEILIPVLGVFVGVIALAATVIGFLYTTVSRAKRAAFAVSSLLLMAPGLLLDVTFDLLGLVSVAVSPDTFLLSMGLRAVGLVVFVALVVENRRESNAEPTPAEAAEPA